MKTSFAVLEKEFGNHVHWLLKLLAHHDAMSLISMSCPQDEYLPEARRILPELRKLCQEQNFNHSTIQKLVFDVFDQMFSSKRTVSGLKIESFNSIAKDIADYLEKNHDQFGSIN